MILVAEKDPLGSRWKLWGGILAVTTVLCIVGLVSLPGEEDPRTVEPTDSIAAEAPTTSAPSAEGGNGDCPGLSTDKAFPNDAPETDWKRHPSGALLPVSSAHGPAKSRDAFWRCYSHTPSGAVLAGYTLMIDFSAGRQIEAAADSAKREELFDEQGASSGNGDFPPLLGYRVASSSDDKAVLEYLSKYEQQYAALSIDLVWSQENHDWRLDLSQSEPSWKLVDDPSSYTEFK